MSTEQTTEKKTEAKPKLSPQESAQAKAVQILNSGIALGKAMGKTESKDPRRKTLGVIVNTVAGRQEKGKEVTFKSLKSSYNGVDDDRENYAKAKTFAEKALGYFSQLPKPEPKPKPKPSA